MHKPIFINNINISFNHKICLKNFTTIINYGSRIALIGRNGSGKTTLLRVLQGLIEPMSGSIRYNNDVVFGYVAQIINDHVSLSGGQRLNKVITQALTLNPNVLILDEPTNHLDEFHRKSLIRMLKNYTGTLIVASHDISFIQQCIDTIWHLDDGKIHTFTGNYVDYKREVNHQRLVIEQTRTRLKNHKKKIHDTLMKEQQRVAKNKTYGLKKKAEGKYPSLVANAKPSQSQLTASRKKAIIDSKNDKLTEQLLKFKTPESIRPKFNLNTVTLTDRAVLSIQDGTIGYEESKPLVKQINLSIGSKDRIIIEGDNASGKTSLIKAILNDPSVLKSGSWNVPKANTIGYLDQHYGNLDINKSVFNFIQESVPDWSLVEIRNHLNNFLFRKNDEVNLLISQLSGGEKARLSLAQIAAYTPKLLILDEVTNNLDIETKNHIIDVLNIYPGAMIIISHDVNFINNFNVHSRYKLKDGMYRYQ